MITEITIKNYRSIWDATVELRPFTLLIGANGAGKSNFVSLIYDVFHEKGDIVHIRQGQLQKNFVRSYGKSFQHINHRGKGQKVSFASDTSFEEIQHTYKNGNAVQVFSIDPSAIGKAETLTLRPSVNSDGTGAVQVLDALKTGDREDLFDAIESSLVNYVPEIEKISFFTVENAKKLQIRERFISEPIALDELSEGTRLVLTILTIIHQENPPRILCLEDIDRGLHPRLFKKLIDLCFQITEEKDIQIIATTHNPYLVNKFYGYEDAVIIVEKENGETKFTTLEERIEGLEVLEGDPLGGLWYSGFVGGVPEVRRPVR